MRPEGSNGAPPECHRQPRNRGGAALFGKAFRVTRERGRLVPSRFARYALATVHPSSLLRAPDEETRRREIERFIDDLRKIAEVSRGA